VNCNIGLWNIDGHNMRITSGCPLKQVCGMSDVNGLGVWDVENAESLSMEITVVTPPPPPPTQPTSSLMHEHIQRTETALSQILQCIANGPGPAVKPLTLTVTPPFPNDMVMAVNSNDQQVHATQALEVHNIQLGNGRTIHITEDDVPNPPHSHSLMTSPTSTASGTTRLSSGTAPRLCFWSKESLWPSSTGQVSTAIGKGHSRRGWRNHSRSGSYIFLLCWIIYLCHCWWYHPVVSGWVLPKQEPCWFLAGILCFKWQPPVILLHQSDPGRTRIQLSSSGHMRSMVLGSTRCLAMSRMAGWWWWRVWLTLWKGTISCGTLRQRDLLQRFS
jgi:hypothetical protein